MIRYFEDKTLIKINCFIDVRRKCIEIKNIKKVKDKEGGVFLHQLISDSSCRLIAVMDEHGQFLNVIDPKEIWSYVES